MPFAPNNFLHVRGLVLALNSALPPFKLFLSTFSRLVVSALKLILLMLSFWLLLLASSFSSVGVALGFESLLKLVGVCLSTLASAEALSVLEALSVATESVSLVVLPPV